MALSPASAVTALSGLELLTTTSDLSMSSVSDVIAIDPLQEWDHTSGNEEGKGDSLQSEVESSLLELSRGLVMRDADRYATHWILFCRAVALSLRAASGKSNPTPA